jgi:hypothetical protein
MTTHFARSTLLFHHFKIFLYLFYHEFAKIYGPSQILQKYTSAAVAHDVRDITLWPTAAGVARSGPLVWSRRSAQCHDVRGLTSWATASGPSAMDHGGSRPPNAVAHCARVQLPI